MVPKMIKFYINVNTTNMIQNYIKDLSYFITPNVFYLNFIKIGPFSASKNLDIKIQDFLQNNITKNQKEIKRTEKVVIDNTDLFYIVLVSIIINF